MLPLFSFLAVFFWFLNSHAILVNVTIDDNTGDPLTGALVSYTPPDAWTIGDSETISQSRSPPGIPDLSKVGGRTFHNSTFSPNSGSHPNVPLTASVRFNGSAVYVYTVLSRFPDGNSDMTFYLDGVVVGNFIQAPVGSAGFDYTVLVYANPSITPGPHTLTIQNGRQNGPESILILDSIVYTYDDEGSAEATAPPVSSPSASSMVSARRGPSSATLAVVGVLVFAVVALLIILGVCLHRRRRRRRAVYAKYMPQGAVRAFPADLAPSRPMSPALSPALSPLPPVYAGAGGSASAGNWWVGRDQKSRDGPRAVHRPFVDLDPSQAGIQRPQGWERKASYQY
ncbi:hypothetical protein MVEN_01923200 [Mycena venus]|uniref:Transmembrane protein n=1 Tax=Mycena venus TaxID=2733690 RepID=A0A8H6XFC6_9AGAR|nr:hypothetical protein MVEN_01923200 [Mycena venus]